ncbi:MAG: ammonium transporter [Verrucomicrobiae bacterium]|nr:ammonium transporter [Verrucomicrobiae bacterium]
MKSILRYRRALAALPLVLSAFASPVFGQDAAVVDETASALSAGDTAWMIVATCLVLFMTLPGLALFYGGLVRTKNILSILVQCFVIAAVMSLLWFAFGYSFALSGGNSIIGTADKVFLRGVSVDSMTGTIPESVYFIFQMTFAIITPALIVGAFAERMKFSAVLLFTSLWFILSYLPIWHMAWGGGLFADWGVIDFAGGTVVHINAGIAGLVACILVGKRKGYGNHHMAPHNVPFTVIGASMLWVGWFGFNAGSELAADGVAGMAMLVTQLATATAVLAWLALEKFFSGAPTAVGAATGAVAGLVAITPASGTASPVGALVIGLASAVVCYFFATTLKRKFGYDDSLDVFGVHGVGGIVGALLTGVFILSPGEGYSMGTQVFAQLKSVLLTAAWSGTVSVVVLYALKMTIGLRVNEVDEQRGLDLATHGESGYTS